MNAPHYRLPVVFFFFGGGREDNACSGPHVHKGGLCCKPRRAQGKRLRKLEAPKSIRPLPPLFSVLLLCSCAGEEDEDYKRFIKFFKEGTATQRARIILDYANEHLSGTGAKLTPGKKKGNIPWHTYSHVFVATKGNQDIECDKKLDFELFATKLQKARNWTMQQCTVEWNKLKQNSKVQRDYGGHGGSLRLHVPGNLLGGARVNHIFGQEERRQFQQEQKMKVTLWGKHTGEGGSHCLGQRFSGVGNQRRKSRPHLEVAEFRLVRGQLHVCC